jgi:hypothetical protein
MTDDPKKSNVDVSELLAAFSRDDLATMLAVMVHGGQTGSKVRFNLDVIRESKPLKAYVTEASSPSPSVEIKVVEPARKQGWYLCYNANYCADVAAWWDDKAGLWLTSPTGGPMNPQSTISVSSWIEQEPADE